MKKLLIPLFWISLFIIPSCTKAPNDDIRLDHTDLTESNDMILYSVNPYDFDWENADFMPMPNNTQILVPWASGASTQITPEILHDYKKTDGWTLVYNTFSPTAVPEHFYFMLYNKYRGVLRMYYYIPSNSNFIESKNIVHKLGTAGNYAQSSPIMNFAATTLIDFDNNETMASTLEQWQVAKATWYAFEYELAYDPDLANVSYTSLWLQWPIISNQVTQITMNGQSSGTVTGSISLPGFDLTVSPSFNTNNIGDGNIIIKGLSDAEKVKPKLSTKLFNSIKDLVTKNITSGVSGVIQNLLSGIFGGKSAENSDNVNLRIKSDISMQGALESSFLVSASNIYAPGTSYSGASGYVPLYDEPLGVFYVSDKPVVNREVQSELMSDGMTYMTRQDYTVDDSSFDVIFNNALSDEVDFGIPFKEVVLFDMPDNGIIEIYGTEEEVGEDTIYTGVYPFFSRGWPRPKTTDLTVGIRISFDVIPKDGSKKTRIVKTFLADVVDI